MKFKNSFAKHRNDLGILAGFSVQEWIFLILVFLVSSFITLVAIYVFYGLEFKTFSFKWIDLMARWDSVHYAAIAETGYETEGQGIGKIAFFPLLPMFVKPLIWIGVAPVIATSLIANIFLLLTSFALYQLVKFERNSNEAKTAVLALYLFPTAYFLRWGYSEGLFLFFSIVSIYSARNKRWILSGWIPDSQLDTLWRSASISGGSKSWLGESDRTAIGWF